jgi:hypothetical protein
MTLALLSVVLTAWPTSGWNTSARSRRDSEDWSSDLSSAEEYTNSGKVDGASRPRRASIVWQVGSGMSEHASLDEMRGGGTMEGETGVL